VAFYSITLHWRRLSSYMYLGKGLRWAIALHWRRAVLLHVPGEGFTLGYSPPLEEGCLVTFTWGRVHTGL